ncbi:hypothetical protein [Janthinobacterium psychrotolerans]|uniref:Uncharacterized protein n=1 Tax=Janthinobacterium psychrotolerans TaxID=1747903 RepID=A0A1A7C8S4_9BURK|nr:hypothetical protein [Janthinobacterium psychrotolerans]OBV41409.1 hypothetical protein ASR47_103038 [Janthinobacterium psychrotolerans]
MENYFETALLNDLHGPLLAGTMVADADSAGYFARLAQRYPVTGSKIRWSDVPGAIERRGNCPDRQLAASGDFFRAMVALHGLHGQAVYLGDSAIDFALLAPVSVFALHLEALLPIPQHHYFMAADDAWCMVLSMEGDMAFGLRPS